MPIKHMPLAEFFDIGTLKVDPYAAAQQALLMFALYEGDRGVADDVFDGVDGYKLDKWTDTPGELVPSYLVGHQGANVYVTIAGTQNTTQMFAHFGGYLARPYDAQDGVMVNAFWEQAWLNIKADVLAAMGPVGTNIFHFSGHSFGAVIAMLAALDFKRAQFARQVSWLGLGCPAGLAGAYGAIKPDLELRVSNEEDPVARLPNAAQTLVNASFLDQWVPQLKVPWEQRGVQNVLTSDLYILPAYRQEQIVFYLASMGIDGCFATHGIKVYLDRLLRRAKRGVLTPTTQDYITDMVIESRTIQRFVAPRPFIQLPARERVMTPLQINDAYYEERPVVTAPPQINLGTAWDFVVPYAAKVVSSALPGRNVVSPKGRLMAGPSNSWKVTLSFSTPQEDNWNEIYFAVGSLNDIRTIFGPGSPLNDARLALLNVNYTFQRVRYSSMTGNRARGQDTVLAKGGDGAADLSAIADTSLILFLGEPTGNANRHIFMRGFSADFANYDATGRLVFRAGARAKVTAFLAALCVDKVRVPYVRKRTGADKIPAEPVVQVEGDGLGSARLFVPTGHKLTVPQPAVPERVILGAFSQKDLPAINGRYDVLAAPDATHFVVRYRVPNDQLFISTTGNMRKEVYEWGLSPSADSSGITSLGGRQTKNAGTGSRGRGRARTRRSSL